MSANQAPVEAQAAGHLPSALAAAISAFSTGKPVIMVDDALRENEGDLVVAAQLITPDAVNFMATNGRGLICLALEDAQVRHLDLPMMPRRGHDPRSTAFTVSIEATSGISTGISARDRARTIQIASDPAADPAEISTPGHIFPLKAHPDGCVARAGHTEGSIDLARLCGLNPAAVICEIINDDGTMARLPDLQLFGKTHNIPILTIAELASWCASHGRGAVNKPSPSPKTQTTASPIHPIAVAQLPSAFGGEDLTIQAFRAEDGMEHLALFKGNPKAAGCLVRVHSECITGDALGSLRCDCGPQLRESLTRIRNAENGLLVYLRGQEGRGIGLGNKMRAYALQDRGADTLDANLQLGLPSDARDWQAAAAILSWFGSHDITLLTNNPDKTQGLAALGITVKKTEALIVGINPFNKHYLMTKRSRMGHQLDTAPESFLKDFRSDELSHD